MLADSGYACGDQVERVESKDIEVYVSPGTGYQENERTYDYRPRDRIKKTKVTIRKEWLKDMKRKMETDTGRKLYARRKQTVEPVFGIIKEAMGFRQFLLRGLDKVSGEWQLVATAYNMKRLWNMQRACA